MVSDDEYLYFADRALDGIAAILTELGDERANVQPDLPGANAPYAIVRVAAEGGAHLNVGPDDLPGLGLLVRGASWPVDGAFLAAVASGSSSWGSSTRTTRHMTGRSATEPPARCAAS